MVKIDDYVERTVPMYLPQQFQRMFRLRLGTMERFYEIIKDDEHFRHNGYGGRPTVPTKKKILITLWYLSSQESLVRIADRFGVTEFIVIKARRQVMKSLIDRMDKFIKWPNVEQRKDMARRIERTRRFPNVIGCIDGTHIKIAAPKEDSAAYVNRKSFHSINVQAVCDSAMKFTDVFVGYPGGVHDARVLRNSPLSTQMGIDSYMDMENTFGITSWATAATQSRTGCCRHTETTATSRVHRRTSTTFCPQFDKSSKEHSVC